MAAKRKMKRDISIDHMYMGPEPTWDDEPTHNLSQAFNWYNHFYTNRDAKRWLTEYMLTDEELYQSIPLVKALPDWRISRVAGWYARMLLQGAPFEDRGGEFIRKHITKLAEYREEVQQETSADTPPTKTVAQRTKIRAGDFIAELEGLVDDHITGNDLVDPYDLLTEMDVKGKHARHIVKHFTRVSLEVERALDDRKNKKQTDFAEAYAGYTLRSLRALIRIYSGIIDAAQRIILNSKRSRPPRKKHSKRGINAEKMVAGVKYMKEAPDYQLVSEHPANLVGAKAAFVFNTRNKTLILLVADRPEGFTVSRSKIKNVDQTKSGVKRIGRKIGMLEEILKGQKLSMIRKFNNIKGQTNSTSGRINDAMVIVKVYR